MSLAQCETNITVIPTDILLDHIDEVSMQDTVAIEANDNTLKILSLKQFIDDFGSGLLNAVRLQNPPIFNGEINNKRAAILSGLKRQPFAAQAKTIQAVTKLLLDHQEKAAVINAEMGTGKTLMGIATAALLHAEGYSRTLVLCPPHLVYKWRREILETVVDAEVVILNGSDTLKKLQAMKLQQKQAVTTKPVFYIMGRVRLRMGHHWQIAAVPRRIYAALQEHEAEATTQWIEKKTVLASCATCGEFVTTLAGRYLRMQDLPQDKKLSCLHCKSPLWTLMHPREPYPLREQVKQGLCQLPGIGNKMAEQLLTQFGENLLARSLGDNVYQLIQLMDGQGKFVFSDNHAARLERAFGSCEINIGQAGYQASEYIKRYLPKDFFSLLIVDEGHEYKAQGSAQGQAMGVLAGQVQKVLLLTGTLMGGYADDLFHLLWRIIPQRMMEDGYQYNARGSLGSAAMSFMQKHGVLKEVFKTSDAANHRTARGKRESVHVSKAPGFGPMGVARYLLPYTAFLKLQDLEQNALPTYQEQFLDIPMDTFQASHYRHLESKLRGILKRSLAKGDHTLLGVVLNCLLAWPDCCFREEIVKHPRTKEVLGYAPAVLDENASSKEEQLIELCLAAKQAGRRTLVYSIYTGTRDTTGRLKNLLTQAELKTAVLKASISADRREDWIAEQVAKGIDVLICHPELVKTGLDLLAFPTIVFMQSGYNVYTLMQATRRSWRIGQKLPVEVYFLGYSGTAQIQCLSLMAKKIAVSQSTSGTMPESGLDMLNMEVESVEVALARQLIQA